MGLRSNNPLFIRSLTRLVMGLRPRPFQGDILGMEAVVQVGSMFF
jgi:hypothetical protein